MLPSTATLLLLAPALLLGAGAWLSHVPGEWCRAALLAWAALLLAQQGTVAITPFIGSMAAPLALLGAFLALSLGGIAGLVVVAVLLAAAATAGLSQTADPSWAPSLVAAIAAALAALRAAI